jgi:carboxyl-terminal processing protease
MTGKSKKAAVVLIAAALVAIAGGAVTRFTAGTKEKSFLEYKSFFQEVVAMIKKDYVEKIDDKKLMESAINGMLAALDPHNAYMPPEPFHEMQVQMSGSFGGLGMEVTVKDGRLTVVSPIEDTPAYRAGIKSGDHIWKIDNSITRGMNITAAVKRMRGPQGTGVTLTVMRDGQNKPLVFPLIRDLIQTRSLKYRSLAKGYGYIRIAQFQERTGEEFGTALHNLYRENDGTLRGLVLDLRNNPGGLVDAAVTVAGRFIGEGLKDALIVSMKGRDPAPPKNLAASIGDKEPRYPLVVLINGGSASASEIVAGALQDHQRAIIMGTQSFGKGSVQSIIPLRGGAGLKLTTARYYTPKGRSIQALGITPDIIVGQADLAKQVMKGEKDGDFREKDLDGHIQPAGKKDKNEEKQPMNPHVKVDGETAKDYQLARALDLLRGLDSLGKPK